MDKLLPTWQIENFCFKVDFTGILWSIVQSECTVVNDSYYNQSDVESAIKRKIN